MILLLRKILSNANRKRLNKRDKKQRTNKQQQFSELEQSLLFTKGNYIKRSNTNMLSTIPVNLIAFYLPQFHCIPENDEWWGSGFTEWTNVRSATPLYHNHYQPHIPDELGYYNLLNIEIQKKQAAMARQYGISGFCFYFYWFNGHRLLEQPTLNYLEHTEIDFPFCLCWANENWTRRWDGREKDILIEQNYDQEDDTAFVRYISKYLIDPRYIRVNGKPLLIIYRPNLIPKIKEIVAKWRNWCVENGVGDLYLCYTQSFESTNPEYYGMDAAIEFPPNNTKPPKITRKFKPFSNAFRGHIYDWSIYLKKSTNYATSSYKLLRSMCPSWDNTARRKLNSTSFVKSSPLGYQQWLLNASLDTIKCSKNPSERIIFINAWNEWAEGAHLEPDAKYGFAWLEATKIALQKASFLARTEPAPRIDKLAIVIHAYYDDLLLEILYFLKQIDKVKFKLYVTTPNENIVRAILIKNEFEFHLKKTDNRGRDILPFLQIMEQVKLDGYNLILKIHTKKSPHRIDGDLWRQDLYNKLLEKTIIKDGIKLFQNNPCLGILGPDGHLLSMSDYLGNNSQNLLSLSHRLGVPASELLKLNFFAGSMFMARVSALDPLLTLGLNVDDFEEETGQVDGTMAHAIERAIAVSAYSAGFLINSGGTNPLISDPLAYSTESERRFHENVNGITP